jgi:pyruvate dehydrogenase E2 component (dihydrolipoamide acetyltransferase)
MITEVRMPRLSLTMEVGTVIEWRKAVGDPVAKGEELAEIETDKVNVAMEAPAGGFLRSLLVAAGVEVPCDTPIALLTATADEPLTVTVAALTPTARGPAGEGSPQTQTADQPPTPLAAVDDAGERPHVNASPAAKNLARELGVDLATVTGSGPGGRIGLDDVQRAADGRREAGAVPAAKGRIVPLTKMQAATAQQMSFSVRTVPQFSVQRMLDMGEALRFLRDIRAAGKADQPKPGVADLIHLATVRALQAHPELNASFQAGDPPTVLLHDGVNLGIAVAVTEGLIVPVIHDAHTLSLRSLAERRLRLREDAHSRRLSMRALSGATFTVSNLGPMGVDQFTAILNPPEAAILAVGCLRNSVVTDPLHVTATITVTVTADHRVLDGARVARFLETLADTLNHLDTIS